MKPVIAITVGDCNGIGPEVAVKAASTRAVQALCIPLLVGPWKAFAHHGRKIPLRSVKFFVHPLEQSSGFRVTPGMVSRTAGKIAAEAIRTSIKLIQSGRAAGLVTAPLSKEALHLAGVAFDGQTEYLAYLTGARRVAMILVSGSLRVGLVTIHKPLKDVPGMITQKLLKESILTIARGVEDDLRIKKPRLAVLGLNPHAGEMGNIGDEEQRVIRPALRSLQRRNIAVEGPFPADSFFSNYRRGKYDAVIAMYHDQGLIPLKMLRGKGAVNVTLGLPVVRTSPDHGTAFDIAGRGKADPRSMIEAIKLAVEIVRNRKARARS